MSASYRRGSRQLKNLPDVYVGKITEKINKLAKYMSLGDKSSLEFETCVQKL